MVVNPPKNGTYTDTRFFLMVLLWEVGDARSVGGRKLIQLIIVDSCLSPGPLKYLPAPMPSDLGDGSCGWEFGCKDFCFYR